VVSIFGNRAWQLLLSILIVFDCGSNYQKKKRKYSVFDQEMLTSIAFILMVGYKFSGFRERRNIEH
jgi:hypothetical protein